MSQENVELVREVYDCFAHGDFDAGRELLAADFEWQQVSGTVEPGSHRGVEGRRALGLIFEAFDDFRVDAEEYIDAGNKVIVVGRAHGVARRTRMQLDGRFASVWTVRDGELVSTEEYAEREEALKAVGLEE